MEEINQVIETTERQDVVENEAPETVSKADYDELKAQLEDLQGKIPKEPSETEKELAKLKRELFEGDVKWALKDNGFGQFVPLFIDKVQDKDELENVINTLKEIQKQDKMNNSYMPSGTGSTNTYDQAKQQGNTKGMIKSLFGF